MIFIDYSDKRPIYEQITDRFQGLILTGVLKADEKLPSVRSLAVELSINPNTIQRAFAQLERDGFIYSVKGIGNFVQANESLRQKQKEKQLEKFGNHAKLCMKQGITKEELIKHIQNIHKEAEE